MSRQSKTMKLVADTELQQSDSRERTGVRVASQEAISDGTNIVILRGRLSRAPEHRVLASGSVLLTADVTVRPAEGQADTVPVVWFDPPERALRFDQGDDIVAVGRVRRRFFRAGGATASRTEVVVSTLVSARAPARVRTAITDALESISLPG
jgi:single-strand DNA-binding protein